MRDPADELALVMKAVLEGRTVTGCCEWDDLAYRRVLADAELGLPPHLIRKALIEFVLASGIIQQVKEQRPEYNDFDFYYKAVVPTEGFPNGLFIEMRLTDPDVDCPTVLLVNAHAQRK